VERSSYALPIGALRPVAVRADAWSPLLRRPQQLSRPGGRCIPTGPILGACPTRPRLAESDAMPFMLRTSRNAGPDHHGGAWSEGDDLAPLIGCPARHGPPRAWNYWRRGGSPMAVELRLTDRRPRCWRRSQRETTRPTTLSDRRRRTVLARAVEAARMRAAASSPKSASPCLATQQPVGGRHCAARRSRPPSGRRRKLVPRPRMRDRVDAPVDGRVAARRLPPAQRVRARG
jgi:hypothetical protein